MAIYPQFAQDRRWGNLFSFDGQGDQNHIGQMCGNEIPIDGVGEETVERFFGKMRERSEIVSSSYYVCIRGCEPEKSANGDGIR